MRPAARSPPPGAIPEAHVARPAITSVPPPPPPKPTHPCMTLTPASPDPHTNVLDSCPPSPILLLLLPRCSPLDSHSLSLDSCESSFPDPLAPLPPTLAS
eukprot:3683631-Rhodomonas_salina.3